MNLNGCTWCETIRLQIATKLTVRFKSLSLSLSLRLKSLLTSLTIVHVHFCCNCVNTFVHQLQWLPYMYKDQHRFYRAMLRRARSCDNKLSVCPSVCLSVTLRYRDHIGWNTSKIISRPNSLRNLLTLAPIWTIWCNGSGTSSKLGWNRGGVRST